MTDPLSEVLRSLRLTGAIFLDSVFTAPWSVIANLSAEDCRPYLASPSQMIAYHFVVDGRLMISVEGDQPLEVRSGEVVLLPRNDSHVLSNDFSAKPVRARELVRPSLTGGLPGIFHGGGGDPVRLVCGFLATEELRNPLIAGLPRMLKLDVRRGASRGWVEASVRYAASEFTKGNFASSSVMSRLSELLFVEAVREYSSKLDESHAGWLKGLTDPHVGRALALIHGNPSFPWSAEELAKEVAQSRSAFVERFTTLVGMPPIRYLTLWRLQTAKLNLRETRKTIAQLANSVGYQSEEAFSRAFKREFGVPPAQWRDRQGDAPPALAGS